MKTLNNRVIVVCILIISAVSLVACGSTETVIREVEVTRETTRVEEVQVTRETVRVEEVPVTRVVEDRVEVPVSSSASMNYSDSPTYGSHDLEAGFNPDPYVVYVTSGGEVDVNGDIGSGCYGYAAESPDFTLYWDGWGELGFLFYADDGSDTTLIINDSNGDWHCSDDYDGLNPGVVFNDADSGTYDIWIGSYSYGEYVSGELLITEIP